MTDDLAIPAFLRISKRDRARAWRTFKPAAPAVPQAVDKNAERLALFAAQRKEKSRGRVAKMLAKRSDRAAVEAGKVWDTVRGGWR
jgi:hypothetical protein